MMRSIALIVLIALLPMQVYGLELDPMEKELLTPPSRLVPAIQRPPETDVPDLSTPSIKQRKEQRTLSNIMTEAPPKPVVEEKSGTNWWLWGGIGLAVVAGAALALGGGGGGGSTSSSAANNSGVNVTW
jgi:hypothetical protein